MEEGARLEEVSDEIAGGMMGAAWTPRPGGLSLARQPLFGTGLLS
jgi:hypothetical protein